MDWDNDSRKDLITGVAYGYIRIYGNTGTDNTPCFDNGVEGYANLQTGGIDFDSGYTSAPEIADWDNDGDLDVLCGDYYGNISILINNAGAGQTPSFSDSTDLYLTTGSPLDVGGDSHPLVTDWNGDGNKDLIVGAADGCLYYYQNISTDASPQFNTGIALTCQGSTVNVGSSARPELVDWNGDGYDDLLVGAWDGCVYLYQTANPNLPYISLVDTFLNDSHDGDTNGALSRGETVHIVVSLSNLFQQAENVTAVLSADHNCLDIVSPAASFGTIAQGSCERNSSQPFCVKVSDTAPPQGIYSFTLSVYYDGITSPRTFNIQTGQYSFDSTVPSSWIDTAGGTQLAMGLDSYATISLNFDFPFYGTSHNTVYLVSNGFLSFDAPSYAYYNTQIPDSTEPNAIVAPFWDDLDAGSGGFVRHKSFGTAPNRYWVAEWNAVPHYGTADPLTFQMILRENGYITFQYGQMTGTYGDGRSATIGIENSAGDQAVQYSFNTPSAVTPGMAIEFAATSESSPDTDGDGLPDPFEEFYFGNTTSSDGNTDSDGDGRRDLDELYAATDPLDPDSVLQLTRTEARPGSDVTIQWQCVPGKKYNVERGRSLVSDTWEVVNPAPLEQVSGNTACYTTTVDLAEGACYLRVVVP